MGKSEQLSKEECFEGYLKMLFGEYDVTDVRTFSEAKLVTRDNGVVIDFENGDQFELTIKCRQNGAQSASRLAAEKQAIEEA